MGTQPISQAIMARKLKNRKGTPHIDIEEIARKPLKWNGRDKEPRGLPSLVKEKRQLHELNSVLKMPNYDSDDICNKFPKERMARQV